MVGLEFVNEIIVDPIDILECLLSLCIAFWCVYNFHMTLHNFWHKQ
jgi:hypothetical protein